jgi:NAD(P)H-dependent FMN reductase
MTSARPTRRLLALSGSLRARSVNTAVLQALASLAPPGVEVTLYRGLGELPHFNPDLDCEPLPAVVAAFRQAVAESAAIIFCTPEYAHGVPGSLKNALDWLVSFEGFIAKPVVLVWARPGGDHAQASLREILAVMNARVLEEAGLTLPLTSNAPDAAALLEAGPVRQALASVLERTLAALSPDGT